MVADHRMVAGHRMAAGRRTAAGHRMAVVIVLLCSAAVAQGRTLFDDKTAEFLGQVDSRNLALLAVQYRGRAAVMDTVARDYLAEILGTESIDGISPAVAYLELFINTGRYLDRPVIYVREAATRRAIAGALTGRARDEFSRTDRFQPASLLTISGGEIGKLIAGGRVTAGDLARAKGVCSLGETLTRLGEQRAFTLPLTRLSVRWDAFLAVGAGDPASVGSWYLLPATSSQARLAALRTAWRSRDAEAVNRLCAAWLAGRAGRGVMVAKIELLYNRTSRSPAIFACFAAALVLLIVAAASGRKTIRRLALGVFTLATLALLARFAVRWLLSGRAWYLPPVMNQYEAVAGSALLGAILAGLLELIYKRNYFALAASVYASAAMLVGLIFPRATGAGIAATPGILNSPIMAAHVSVIILGHALAGMTLVISLVYLAVAARRVLAARPLTSAGADLASGSGDADGLAAIDRCNLIVTQLATWSILAGTILGAVWGQFAWGRWWGWDPKETWALITVLVYLAVLHLRFVTPREYRGLVTSLGCLLGAAVMIFNWTVVNYLLSGKHSYA